VSEPPPEYRLSKNADLTRLLAAWDSFAAKVRERLAAFHPVYGNAWCKRGIDDNFQEAQAEALDLAAYGFFAWVLLRTTEHK